MLTRHCKPIDMLRYPKICKIGTYEQEATCYTGEAILPGYERLVRGAGGKNSICSNCLKHFQISGVSNCVSFFFSVCPILSTWYTIIARELWKRAHQWSFQRKFFPFPSQRMLSVHFVFSTTPFSLEYSLPPLLHTVAASMRHLPSEIFLVSIYFRMLSCPLLLYTWFLNLFLGLIQQDGESFEGL